jgi:hypothetical protein
MINSNIFKCIIIKELGKMDTEISLYKIFIIKKKKYKFLH